MKHLGIVLAIFAATTHAGEPRTLYVRAQIEKATSGTVVVTSQYEPVLDLPGVDCADGEFSCLTEQQYGQLYRFDFLFTQLRKTEAGQVVANESSAGTIYLVADMDKAQELQFEEAVEASIALLHGDSFRHAYAGWGMGAPPFVQEILLGPSNQSVWLCMEHEDAERELRITPQIEDGQVVGVTQASAAEPVVKACESLRAARRLEGGRRTTTSYDIESLVRTEIIVSVDWYRGDPDLGGFQSLPDEMLYAKTKVDHQNSRGSMSVEDGVVYSMERSKNGVSQKFRLGTYAIEPPRPHSAAWVTRWTISTHEQTFGAEAAEELLDRQELWIVALPLSDPLAQADAVFPGDPGETLLDSVVGSFDRAAWLSNEVIAQAFQRHVAGLLEGDWMFVYCPARGIPEYSIARFQAKVAIENGGDVCDVVRGLYAAN